ncbi:MAG: flavin reductase family protein [Deinococcus sp.]|nr:flavin reductase family protein [Deinococcus sp.]
MNEQAKRAALRLIPYGLYVITYGTGAEANGFTSTWLSQASFRPPLVMTGVGRGRLSEQVIRRTGVFVVNFLGRSQKALAERFFKPVERLADLGCTTGVTGAPILNDALAYLECQVRDSLDLGDHLVVVGEVVAAEVRREEPVLELSDTSWHYGG